MSSRPKPLPRMLKTLIILIIILIPVSIVGYKVQNDPARKPAVVKNSSFILAVKNKQEYVSLTFGEVKESSKIFLLINTNYTGNDLVIYFMDEPEFKQYTTKNFEPFYKPSQITIISKSTWANITVLITYDYYLVVEVPSSPSNSTLDLTYWIDLPTYIESNLLGILTYSIFFYLIVAFSASRLHKYRLKRYRIRRNREREIREEKEFQRKIRNRNNKD